MNIDNALAFEKRLLEKGYKKFDPPVTCNESVRALYQKRFDDSDGKCYFIDVFKWDFSGFSTNRDVDTIGFEYDVQFYQAGKHCALTMTFHSDWSIDDVESYCCKLFGTGWFDHYELWSEC